jgi:O-phosphoseryl-tRNA(Sec) selenium transferase, SepSecS
VHTQAAGSSLLAKICHFLALDALRAAGLPDAAAVQVFPLATGMAMTAAFLACAAARPEPASARCAARGLSTSLQARRSHCNALRRRVALLSAC